MLAVGFFIIFDIAGLSLNFLLSWRIEQQAIGINLAGRQRMLSQRMVKTLLQIDNARKGGEDPKAYMDELKLTFDLFDNTLRGFDVGGETKGGAGEKLFLQPVKDARARKAVVEAVDIWKDYRARVVTLLAAASDQGNVALQAAMAEANARNLKLLALMNTLTTELETMTQREAQRIRVYQALTLLLAIVCFVWAFILFRRRDEEVMNARQIATDTARAERDYAAGLATKITLNLQTADDLPSLAHALFESLAEPISLGCAVCFRFDSNSGMLQACGGYALNGEIGKIQQIALGERLPGLCALERRTIVVNEPPDDYLKPETSLMKATPRAIMLLPIVNGDRLLGVIEMALLQPIEPRHQEVMDTVLPLLALRMDILGRSENTAEKQK